MNIYAHGEGFIAGTLVKTVDGYKAIEHIAIDDIVISSDLQGNLIKQSVCDLIKTQTEKLIKLQVNGDTVVVDYNHYFYLPLERRWVQAQFLKADQLLLAAQGAHVAITHKEQDFEKRYVFDFRLLNYHNFLVSKQDLVVHNFAGFIISGGGRAIARALPMIIRGVKFAGSFVAGLAIEKMIGKNKNKHSSAPPNQDAVSHQVESRPDYTKERTQPGLIYYEGDKIVYPIPTLEDERRTRLHAEWVSMNMDVEWIFKNRSIEWIQEYMPDDWVKKYVLHPDSLENAKENVQECSLDMPDNKPPVLPEPHDVSLPDIPNSCLPSLPDLETPQCTSFAFRHNPRFYYN